MDFGDGDSQTYFGKSMRMLVLETGLGNPGFAIFEDGECLDYLEVDGNSKRSEDSLASIEKLLERNKLVGTDLDYLGISKAPGSVTGLRIGSAIAKGLGDAFSAKVLEGEFLRALANAGSKDGRILCGVWLEKTGVFYQEFEFDKDRVLRSSEIIRETDFEKFAEKLTELDQEKIEFVFNAGLVENLNAFEQLKLTNSVRSVPGSFSVILGHYLYSICEGKTFD